MPRSSSFRQHLYRRILPAILLVIVLSQFFSSVFVSHHDDAATRAPIDTEDVGTVKENGARVALEAHIMSKCPDARDCLRQLVVPAMVQISDKVDFQLSFIGTYATVDPWPRSERASG